MADLTNTDKIEVVLKSARSTLYKLKKVHLKRILINSKIIMKNF